VAQAYGVRAIPQTFFIDADGRIQDRVFGVTSDRTLDRELQVLLSSAGTTDRAGGRATIPSPPS
jgi:hypothetical protein